MIISKISLDPLDKNRKEILFKLNPFFKKGAILAGDTALMLQFYYRKSHDFDLFFPQSLFHITFVPSFRTWGFKFNFLSSTLK